MNITSGKILRPQKVVIYGPEGIGKSTLASKFPDPVFIDTEGSTIHMDVRRVETPPKSWTELLELVRQFRNPGICKTLVLDTGDWAEQLCAAEVCAKYQKQGIEDFGYGKGYTYLQEEFGRLLNELTEVIGAGAHVVITAHAKMRKFEQPDEMGSYDRWEMKLSKQVAPLVKEWADMVLFANFKTYVVAADDSGKKHKAQGGKRVLYTSHHPCWDAKNRHDLPEEIPLDYEAIRAAIEAAALAGTPGHSMQRPEPKPEQASETAASEAVESGKAAEKAASGGEGIPEKLKALMEPFGVTEAELREVIGEKGYYPADTPWSVLDADGFVEGWILPFWDNIVDSVRSGRGENNKNEEQQELPFV